jgi:carboxyl-terminal processing protease
MRTLASVILCCLAFITYLYAGSTKNTSIASQAVMIIKTAEKYHYLPKPVNDTFSEVVYGSFLHMLDPYGIIFSDESVRKLDSFKFALDNQIKEQKTAFLETATSLYVGQLHSVDSIIKEISKEEFDLTINDTLWLNSKTVWGKQRDLKRKWEQWIKYLILWTIHNNADSTGTAVLPAGKELHKILSDVITRETCRIQLKINPPGEIMDFTGSLYLKAISSAFDPHTQYLSLAEAMQWETDLSKESGSFGIRINFNLIGEIEIVDLVPGGPAWNSTIINEGDVILDIKKRDGTTIDLRCATFDDVHNFLSSIGNKQTDFKIRKKNGKIISVSLKKELLNVDCNTIRSYVLKGSASIGYIYLPLFYSDFTYANYFSKGCANDLAKELIKLKKDSIDGLILDLRDNGGGSLKEALRVAGIFIDQGALCITHSRGDAPEIKKDEARGTIYNGPLVVLVNSSSASASELFAGVMQDYNRAVIVGSKTFGKSTIQQMLPVDAGNFDSISHYKGDPPAFITLTIGTFYHVTGISHQKIGITPDILLPNFYDNAQFREASYDGVLEFGKCNKKTYYTPEDTLPIDKLKRLCDTRMKDNSIFKYIKRMGALVPGLNSRYPVPLVFQLFDKYVDRFDGVEDSVAVKECLFTIVLPDSSKIKSSMTDLEKTDNEMVIHNIKDDISINETFSIINDLIKTSLKKRVNR